jgi:predicted nucleotidyltransferase component of viral defense system
MPTNREGMWASLRQRLLNIAHEEHVDFQTVLTRFGLERFLYRLGQSKHRDEFLLKGAFLYYAWQNDVARPTRDIDLLGRGTPDIARLTTVINDIISCSVEDDGLDFDSDTIQGQPIREASLYDGIRFKLSAMIGRTKIPLQVDIGFGDAIGTSATVLKYPTLLDHRPPSVLAYHPSFVVAEKFEAMVVLGMINTRLKDYYDIWKLVRTMDVPQQEYVEAIRATFSRRGTDIPAEVPAGLTDDYAHDDQKRRMWNAFIDRNGLDVGQASFESVVKDLRSMLMPLAIEARGDTGSN